MAGQSNINDFIRFDGNWRFDEIFCEEKIVLLIEKNFWYSRIWKRIHMNPRKNINQQLSKEKFEVLRLYQKLSTHWYTRVKRVKIKVFKKVLFDNFSTLIGYFGPVNTIYCWVRWVWSEFMPFKKTWNYQIFQILCYLGVKLTIVAKPQIPNNIPF